ncbi:MAG: SRPBCC family protein [Acidimicrobiaceae bacterium]|nr:SRPBCC family protein [Acidimicrobiaceae bacterium]MDE0607140.1 SRPBCC family protein [Acidimicrobiaceae bacterium]
MAHIRVETELAAGVEEVWEDICDIASHVEWMHDAESIVFTSDQRQGFGTTFDCLTKIGPIRLTDRMEITEWTDQEAIGVRHVGLVTGEGRFTIDATGDDTTRFVWAETLHFPWWLGGQIGSWIGSPILRRVWRRNLQLLQARF